MPDIETNDPLVTLLLWACTVLIGANIAQWAWMMAVMRSNRKERAEALGKLGDLLEHNTRTINELVIWLRASG